MDNVEGRLREVRDWLLKGDHDLRAAGHILTMENPPADTVCFHAQQAAEKALKAFLVFHEIVPDKTHDLSVLIEEISDIDPSFLTFEDAADILTPYAVTPRYPGGLFYEQTIEQAREALAMAREIYKFVKGKLSESERP